MSTESNSVASDPPRFSLGSLLIVTAAVSLMLVPLGRLGEVFLPHAAVCMAALLVAGSLVWFGHTGVPLLLCVPAVFVCLVAGPLGGVATLFFLFVTIAVTYPLRNHPAWRLGIVYAVLLGSIWMHYHEATVALRRVDELRERFPLVSIRDRLPSQVDDSAAAPIHLAADVESALAEQELAAEYEREWGKSWALEQLHSEAYRRFVVAQNFGSARMSSSVWWALEYADHNASMDGDAKIAANPATSRYDLHRKWVGTFVPPGSLGYVRSLDQVADFTPHGANNQAPPLSSIENKSAELTLIRLELVGLVLHERPVAYLSDSLPAMDQAERLPTRELDEFERTALAKLRQASDLEVDDHQHPTRMLGSIRAAGHCLDCHQVARGELLGAFSYQFEEAAGTE